MAASIRPSLRIAFFISSLAGGGAERSIVALANSIASLNVIVDLVLGDAIGPYLVEVSPRVRIVNLSSKCKLRAIVRLMRYLKRDGPQVIMSSLDLPNIQLVLAARLARFKGMTVISQRATIAPVYAEAGWMRRLVYVLGIRGTYPYADFVICNSRAAAIEVRKMSGMSANRVLTIHNSVDAERINRLANEPLRDSWFLNNRAPLVVSVGSLTRRKDMGTLIKAFATVKLQRRASLVIIGKGAEERKIKNLISVLGLNADVYLPGFDANPYKWMAAATVVVSSSTAEGFPNVVAEALALGRSVVATDCPSDTAELLGHGKWGRLVPVGDPERMAEAMLASLDDPNPPDGRIRAADFSPASTVGEYLKVLLPGTDSEAPGVGQPQ
jgi:glycosyltransferase involved in cell wall biosynthesis